MKKRLLRWILIFTFTFAGALACVFAFSACDLFPEYPHGHRHSYVYSPSDSTEATCTEPAYVFYECLCGDSYKEKIPDSAPLGHDVNKYVVKQATCTECGYVYYRCNRCGDIYNSEIVQPLGHTVKYIKGREATCSQVGWEDYERCIKCDYTTYKEIPVAHSLVKYSGRASTCSQHGYEDYEACVCCDYSTYKELPLLEHEVLEWKSYRSYCAYTCAECGSVKDTALHNFIDGECSSCGLERNTYPEKFNGVYGYENFGAMKDGEGLQKLYKNIDYEVRAFHDSGESASGDYCFAEIDFTGYGITKEQAISVWKTYRDDNPLYYWFSNVLSYNAESIALYVFEAYADGEARTAQNNKIYAACEEWTKYIGAESSAYMKTLAFHDLIIQAVDYAYDGNNNPQTADWAHSILGVFEELGAVCESYAKTFQLLLNVCGVDNLLVTGVGVSEAHAWNLVKLDDGEWYWYDLTWDDTPKYFWGISYTYFACTDESFQYHTADSENGTGIKFLYSLPERSQTEYAVKDEILRKKFSANSMEFTIIGYNLVSLSGISGSGELEIPSSVTYGGCEYTVSAIGGYDRHGTFANMEAEYEHRGFSSVFIPASVRFIAPNSFYHLDKLEEINVAPNNPAYCSVDGILFTKSRDILMVFPDAHRFTSYSIPEETTGIGYHAFGSLSIPVKNLESLTVHSRVIFIGADNSGYGFIYAMVGTWSDIVFSLRGKKELIIEENNPAYKVIDGLIMQKVYKGGYTHVVSCMPHVENVIIPDTVTGINMRAFMDNNWIKSVSFPRSLTEIIDYQFCECTALESVYIPNGVINIGKAAFLGCTNLKSVSIPDSVTSIGKWAFEGCSKLASVKLGSDLKEIGEEAFNRCTNLFDVYNGSKFNITKGSKDYGSVGYYAKNIYTI